MPRDLPPTRTRKSRVTALSRLAAAACVVAGFATLALSPAAALASVTDTYGCTGGLQSTTAPAGAITALVTLNGAAGSDNGFDRYEEGYGNPVDGGLGGAGDGLTVSLPVSGGEVFDVQVGCQNDADLGGAYVGGGDGGADDLFGEANLGAGNGGGASDITPSGASFASAYAVAGGGGGGGDFENGGLGGGNGGNGGNASGTDGAAGSILNFAGTVGSPGSGGAGGTAGGDPGAGGTGGANGTAGSTDQGGAGGGGNANHSAFAGGGGGGGWVGGGGGGGGVGAFSGGVYVVGSGGGGGGGSSYVASGVTEVGTASATNTGDGSVSITYEFAASAATDPTSENYGAVQVGHSSAQTVQVTNSGGSPLNVGQATIGGAGAGQFALVPGGDSCSNASVDPQASCTIDVEFSPTTDGASSATLTIPSNDPNSPATVALSGTGQTPPTAASSASSQDFATVTVGQAPAVRTTTITNTGDLPLTLDQAAIGGPNADQFAVVPGQDSCTGQTLPAGGTCTIAVQFAPTLAGTMTATLSIASNATASPTTVGLTGVGQAVAAPQPPTPQPPTPQPPAPQPTPAPQPPAPPSVTAPVPSGGGLTVQAGGRGSHVDLEVSAPGTLTVTFERNVGGNWLAAGTRTLAVEHAGRVPLSLDSRQAGHMLAPGPYRVLVQASAGGQSSQMLELPLTVTPPANGPHGQPRLLSVGINPPTVEWHASGPHPQLWLTFLLSRAATLNMTLQTHAGGSWRQLAQATTSVRAGTDRVQLVGRWHGQMVPARVLRLTVQASAADRTSATQTFYVTVAHDA